MCIFFTIRGLPEENRSGNYIRVGIRVKVRIFFRMIDAVLFDDSIDIHFTAFVLKTGWQFQVFIIGGIPSGDTLLGSNDSLKETNMPFLSTT